MDYKGTNGSDKINGTNGNDIASGYAGDDSINTYGGNDLVGGGTGDDAINAGSGNDIVGGGAGSDRVFGGSGDDRLEGFGGTLINKEFDFGKNTPAPGGATNYGSTNSVPGWEVSASGDSIIRTFADQYGKTGLLYTTDTNTSGGANGGSVTVSQNTGLAYNSSAKYEFNLKAFSGGYGNGVDSPEIKLRLVAVDQNTGARTVLGETTSTVPEDTAAKGYSYQFKVENTNSSYKGNGILKLEAEIIGGGSDAPALKIGGASLVTNDPAATADGDDELHGDGGNDLISGGIGSDLLYGDAGSDSLFGNEGDDKLLGGSENDAIAGGLGNDSIEGGSGNDLLFGDGTAGNPVEGNGTFNQGQSLSALDWDVVKGSAGSASITNDGWLQLDTGGKAGGQGGYVAANNLLEGEVYREDEAYRINFEYKGNDDVPSRLVTRFYVTKPDGTGTIRQEIILYPPKDGSIEQGQLDIAPGSFGPGYDGGTIRIQFNAWSNTNEGQPGTESAFVRNVVASSTDPLFGVQGDENSPEGGSDFITGGDGDDEIYGIGGNDKILVGAGDKVFGGYDADTFEIDVTQSGSNGDIWIDGGTGSNLSGDKGDVDSLNLKGVGFKSVKLLSSTKDDDGNSTSGEAQITYKDGTVAKLTFKEIENLRLPCFVRGANILTDQGEKPVEELKVGDLVMTKDNGLKPVAWVGSKVLSKAEIAQFAKSNPIRISAGALGNDLPKRDLFVSPQHRVLVNSKIVLRMFGEPEVLIAAKDLLVIDGVDMVSDFDEVEYFHFMFDIHEIVYSEGAETESLYAGENALKALPEESREEILSLFPELQNYSGEEASFAPARTILKGKSVRKMVERHAKNERALV